MAASAWVASAGLCLRTSSMTFSSASVSACEVDDVAAIAAGTCGLRAGGVACWRVAGSSAGAGVERLAAGVALGKAPGKATDKVLGTTLRAIGRDFGSGTLGLLAACAVHADNPEVSAKASTRLVAKAVDRKAAARAVGVTAFLRGESFNRASPRSI